MMYSSALVIANTLHDLLHAPEDAEIVAPASVWTEAGVDLDEQVADWDDVAPGEDGMD